MVSFLRRRRLVILLVTMFALLVGTLGYIQFWISRPIGEGPAGPAVDAAVFQDVWDEQPVHVLGIGDSITAGLGAKSRSHAYFRRLLQNPQDEFASMEGCCLSAVLPSLTHENLAVSGSDSCQHLDVVSELPQYSAYGIVLLTTGGNDLIHSYGRSAARECAMYGATMEQAESWIRNFRLRLRIMLENIQASFPNGCEIYVADIYDPTDGVGDAPSIFLPHWPDGLSIHARYNQVIRQVAGEFAGVFVVGLHEEFLGHGSHCRQFWRSTYRREDPHYWFYTNIEDPNDRGYDAIRRLFLNSIVANTRLRRRD